MKAIKIVFVIILALCIGFAMTPAVLASELHVAAGQGNLDKVKSLLNKGKKIDERDKNNLTPLHYAAAAAQLEVVKYLISKGANINAQDSRGKTPLHYACDADVTILFGGRDFQDVGFGMFFMDDKFTTVVEFLLSKKQTNYDLADKNGVTPLHEIAGSGTKGIGAEKRLKALLAAGADRTLKDKNGRTPYDLALEKKNQPIVDVLAEIDNKQHVSRSESQSKTVGGKKADITFVNNVINDYLTLIVWIINRENFSTGDVWQTGRDLLDKHHFEGTKARGTVEVPESFEAVLISNGLIALKFRSVWVDPLPILVDGRGDFPQMEVRNGSVSPIDDKVRLRINIGDGIEVMVDGAHYIYRNGQWEEM
jgi:ankyrin repeat protein